MNFKKHKYILFIELEFLFSIIKSLVNHVYLKKLPFVIFFFSGFIYIFHLKRCKVEKGRNFWYVIELLNWFLQINRFQLMLKISSLRDHQQKQELKNLFLENGEQFEFPRK